jgi:O-antigen/teichoic acid export membrane protein
LSVTLIAVALLSNVEYGRFIFLIGVATFIGTLCDLGVSSRMITSYDTERRGWVGSSLNAYWSAQLWSYGIGALVVSVAGVAPAVAKQFHMTGDVIVVGALNGVAVGLFNFLAAVLQATQDWSSRARVIIIQAVARVFGTLIGLLFGSALSAGIGAVVGATLGLVLSLNHTSSQSLRVGITRVHGISGAWRIWRASRWFAAACVVAAIAAYAPIAGVSRVGGAASLAVFGLAFQLSGGPALLLNAVMTFLLPSGSDRGLPLPEYWRLVKSTIVVPLVLLAIAAAAAPVLIPMIFGDYFAGAVLPFELLVAATAVYIAANPIQFLHYRLDGARALAFMDLTLLTVLMGVFVVCIRWLEPPTAAAAAVLTGAVVSRAVGFFMLVGRRESLVAERP